MNSDRKIVLLGPQRLTPTLRAAIADFGLDGPIAVVTAGWEEREAEDEELRAHLGGEVRNLSVWRRCEQMYERDGELFKALSRRHDELRRLQEYYRIELAHALAAARELLQREAEPPYARHLEAARTSAIATVRLLDAHHLGRVREVQSEFEARFKPNERDLVRREREDVARALAGAVALCIAGGHVAILLNRLRLCGVLEAAADLPLFAWSAGAMVLGQRLVLFHDSPPQGAGDAEVLDAGLGVTRGIVALPSAKRRLRIGDAQRVALFARRFDPDLCIALDPGSRIDRRGGQWVAAAGTVRLLTSGEVREANVA